MDYSKYYTPIGIAKALINEINIPTPNKAVDICCGSCNLLYAARDRWPQIKMYGVDIAEQKINDVSFEKKDGRQYAIEHPNEFSLVLANPPFDRIETKKQFPDLFVEEFTEISTSRLEIEMLIANLRLLQQNGVLLIIMPSSFVEAISYRTLRKIVASHFFVEKIIKLDNSTFGTSKINSYALIIHNKKQEEQNTRIGVSNGKACEKIVYDSIISNDKMKKGYWTLEPEQGSNTSIILCIKRGNISSANFITKGQPILHTAKIRDKWKPSRRYISKSIKPTVFAEEGDIIVSRIGKSAGQWYVYSGNKIPISDCLFCIKDPDKLVFQKIKNRTYDKPLKGVATPYITASDFEHWVNKIENAPISK